MSGISLEDEMGILGRGRTKVNGLWEVFLSALLLKGSSCIHPEFPSKIHSALSNPIIFIDCLLFDRHHAKH